MSDSERAKVGRPTLMTPQRVEMICAALENGATRKGAAEGTGVSARTFQRWMQQGARDDADEEFRRFRRRIEEAEACSELELVTLHRRIARGQPVDPECERPKPADSLRAIHFALERRHGWRLPRTADDEELDPAAVSDVIGGTGPSPEELTARVEGLIARAGGDSDG